MYLPLGPCNIYLDNVDLGVTLKEDDVSLEIKVKTEEIKTDESIEIKDIIELGKDITFKASFCFSEESMQVLQIDKTFSNLIKQGELKIVTLDKTVTIFLFKAKLILEPAFNFKEGKLNKIKMKAIALNNSVTKNKIGIFLGADMYDQFQVKIKNGRLILTATDKQQLPNFKIKNKKLIYTYTDERKSNFKIFNGHLIRILE